MKQKENERETEVWRERDRKKDETRRRIISVGELEDCVDTQSQKYKGRSLPLLNLICWQTRR